MAADATAELQELVASAVRRQTPLQIRGSGSKDFLSSPIPGEVLNTTRHRGIVSYEPSELVITARAGTPLQEIEAALDDESQMLAFEPPHFGPGATLGGTLACGLSGPRRAYAGAAKDFVLGTRIINGRAEVLRFGGEVIKNVAGYDISRLMVGAHGSLGLILEASLKLAPKPEQEITLLQQHAPSAGLALVASLARRSLPVSATLVDDGKVYIRLSGSAASVQAAYLQLGGELHEDPGFWIDLREHRLPFFQSREPLWRLSLPATSPALDLAGECLVEWGGALRWLKSQADPAIIQQAVRIAGGHACRFDAHGQTALEHSDLPDALLQLHIRTRDAFDPHRIFNPGRMHTLL